MTRRSRTCARCGDVVSDRTPPEGATWAVGMSATITTTTWKLRLRRFRWAWLPADPRDRVNETYSELNLCDWCAGDVFLFAQGLPPRVKQPSGNAPKPYLCACPSGDPRPCAIHGGGTAQNDPSDQVPS